MADPFDPAIAVAAFALPLSKQEAHNLVVFLERVVCHEGDKQYPPQFTSEYIRTEAKKLLDKVVELTGLKLDAALPVSKQATEDEVHKHVWSARGVCQLCPAVKSPLQP